MTIKKRGLGRGLEALLVDVSTPEVNQVQINNNAIINNPATSSDINQIAEQNNYKNFNNQPINSILNTSELLQEAESLKALLIEFEEILLNR